jgi:hypothetical protein
MKEALSSSETSVLTGSTRRIIPEDAILHHPYWSDDPNNISPVSCLRPVLTPFTSVTNGWKSNIRHQEMCLGNTWLPLHIADTHIHEQILLLLQYRGRNWWYWGHKYLRIHLERKNGGRCYESRFLQPYCTATSSTAVSGGGVREIYVTSVASRWWCSCGCLPLFMCKMFPGASVYRRTDFGSVMVILTSLFGEINVDLTYNVSSYIFNWL